MIILDQKKLLCHPYGIRCSLVLIFYRYAIAMRLLRKG